jgi:hypothetical protein
MILRYRLRKTFSSCSLVLFTLREHEVATPPPERIESCGNVVIETHRALQRVTDETPHCERTATRMSARSEDVVHHQSGGRQTMVTDRSDGGVFIDDDDGRPNVAIDLEPRTSGVDLSD